MAKPLRVIVTGGSGKLGRYAVAALLEAHFQVVLNADLIPPPPNTPWAKQVPFLQVDLEDFGQTYEAFSGADIGIDRGGRKVDCIVHLAAIPAPGKHTPSKTFRNNILSEYNVFEAARKLGIRSVVWASSETVLGIPFLDPPPYLPLDEEYAGRPESSYALSKHLGEKMAEQYARWQGKEGARIVGLRFSNVMDPAAGDYAGFEAWQETPAMRSWNFWGYIDARDGAQAVVKAVLASLPGSDLPAGAHVFVIANADTVMRTPNRALLERLPGIERRGDTEGNRTLLGIEKAKKLLGWAPRHSWRPSWKVEMDSKM
ncbi:nucleoside-diphosphate-sugar epimerase [Hyaloraphidium curvatum]|nr:nucleoside-diphosphate-sugar epimerase [Hyaloraphidium curvatum]